MAHQHVPFIFGRIASGADFTDREKEREQLVANFVSKINTVLASPRRWGKSSLVARAAKEAAHKNSKIRFCFIDLFNVRTEEEFYQLLAGELIKAASGKWEERLQDTKKFFSRIVPKINLSPDSTQEFSFSLDWKELKRNPDEIINLPETISKAKGITMIVCIDEFQNIGYFEEPLALQKKLRSHWQHHKHAAYCLYGSKRHVLMEVFSSPSMPFYKFGDLLFLEKIEKEYWIKFIVKRFADTGKKITSDLAASIADMMENHPFYVQQFAQSCWLRTTKNCDERIVAAAFEAMLTQNSILFQAMVDGLSNTQVNFLRALCDDAEQFSSRDILMKYNLGTSANINRIKQALTNKEIIDTLAKKITLHDPLFKRWLQQYYFKK
ncbi:MAG: ATP-binding protein [Chitinophagales bacterium]|nr:ATP-binding protein [Chitinophagales bacterium]